MCVRPRGRKVRPGGRKLSGAGRELGRQGTEGSRAGRSSGRPGYPAADYFSFSQAWMPFSIQSGMGAPLR